MMTRRVLSASSPSAKGTFIGGCNDGPEAWMGALPNLASGKVAEMLKAGAYIRSILSST